MAERLLQVLPSVMTLVDGELELEADFCEGTRLCLDNFEEVCVACPVTTDVRNSGLRRSCRIKDLPFQNRMKVVALPNANNWRDFLLYYASVRKVINREIQKADYLVFSPHTVIGDWPTLAVREAIKMNRPYVIDADVVYEEVARVGSAKDLRWKRMIKQHVMTTIFQRQHRHSLKHSAAALLQGQDVFDAYAPYCGNPHKVYHMPVSEADYVSEGELQNKLLSLNEARPLRIAYVGRAIEMKGPIDWLKTLHAAKQAGARFEAVWLGDGLELPNMRSTAESLGLTNVTFGGYVSDRDEILSTLRRSDILLFCHKTPESPRCLIEALASGCPLIGYGSSYPRDLVAQCGGGEFTEVGDWQALARVVADLDKDRDMLRELVRQARVSGRLFERDATMQCRIDLMKQAIALGR
ncbi:glycosyltransferase [Bradyrhizobium sp. McL0616]|uniref:glycosyltransferase n=1 Tax=Bradyrhizobium sp. McL0616 TaxID=3415674 RepID=UPI003CE9E013